MKKLNNLLKNNIKLVIGIILGIIVAGSMGVYASSILSSKDIEYSNTSSKLVSTNVQGAIDEIYEKIKPTNFKVGDYVQMTPTKTTFNIPKTLTGYDSNQTINPSELNLWRVIKINDDKTVDMVSEYVSSEYVHFEGQTGYQNYVGTLNYIARQYENQKYTVASRHMGYDGTQTEYLTDTSALTSTTAPQTENTSSSNVTSENEAKGLGDIGYETDCNLVNTAIGTLAANTVGTNTAEFYLLASRNYTYWSTGKWFVYGNYIRYTGSLGSNYLQNWTGNVFSSVSLSSLAVRPIVTLKSEIKATSGDGSSDSPYVLS